MANRRFLGVFLGGLLGAAFVASLATFWMRGGSEKPHRFNVVSQIYDETRISATIRQLKLGKPLKVGVVLESFQNPVLMELTLSDLALVNTDIDQTFRPVEWVVTSQSEDRVEGELVFENVLQIPNELELELYFSDTLQFRWRIDTL